jgi:large subunit ribosomal protein L32e
MARNLPKFIRKESTKVSRVGYKRKKLQKWRRQKGRHNKIRQKMKGYTRRPIIGFGAKKEKRHLVQNLQPVLIFNESDLNSIKPNQIAIVAHTSRKNQIKIAKKAQEKNIKLKNLDVKKILDSEKKSKKPEINSQGKTQTKK